MFKLIQRIACLGFGIIAIVAAPAAAQQQAPNAMRGDPNERVCEDVVPTGSRLAKSRVCATRSEWEAKRRDDREVTERYQRLDLDPCRRAASGASRPC